MECSEPAEEFVYAFVGNIPAEYHSVDLRNYFSMFIESGGFQCFHFRHRPEIRKAGSAEGHTNIALSPPQNVRMHPQPQKDVLSTLSKWGSVPVAVSQRERGKIREKKTVTTCCVVKVKSCRFPELIQKYHRKHWLDRNGDSISRICSITRVNTRNFSTLQDSAAYKTRAELKSKHHPHEELSAADLETLPELHPPDIMPHGNVGTPTRTFFTFIRECRLPPQVIAKLGLRFPRLHTNKMYGRVAYDYNDGSVIVDSGDGSGEDDVVTSGDGHELEAEGKRICPTPDAQSSKQNEVKIEKSQQKRTSGPIDTEHEEEKDCHKHDDSDSDDCEDWERHEALHSDVAHHVERNKDRLFEEEIELKWEKGGSGLVFYTDAQYWDSLKGDFDERTADDWDVDMSVYTDPTAGDKDARDLILMRQERRRRAGHEDTDMYTAGVGKFEKYTKGIGRKVLERQGWKEGTGIGRTFIGEADALENDGQGPQDRSGIGYLGEKLSRKVPSAAKRRRRSPEDVIISTIYDDPLETDPPEALYRTNDHHFLSWREAFVHGGTEGGTAKASTSKTS